MVDDGRRATRLACFDVRNSHTSVGLFEGAELVDVWRLSTAPNRTADEWGVLLSGLLRSEDRGPVEGVCVSSTVPSVLHELRETMLRHFAEAAVVIVGPGVRTGLPVLMDNPREVGTDRVANAVAAAELVGGPCVVVDLGFATTFDVLDANGAYIGGVIAPGVDVSVAALGSSAAQLRQVELERPRSVIARNTIEALQAGAVFGFAGQVDGIVSRIRSELDIGEAELTTIVTGQVHSAVVDECTSLHRSEPNLTLHGLRLIFARNT